jgi:hypothetical protein
MICSPPRRREYRQPGVHVRERALNEAASRQLLFDDTTPRRPANVFAPREVPLPAS